MSKIKPVAPSAFQSFRLHFDWLERTGYFKIILRNVSSAYTRSHYIYRVLIWMMVFVYNMQHLIKVIQVRHSTFQMINVMFILLTLLNTLAKQLSFNLRSARLDRIIHTLNGPYFAPTKPYHVSVLRRNEHVMRYLLWVYMGSVICTGAMWAIFPIVNRMLYQEVELNAYFPFDYNESPWFELSAVYLSVLLTLQGCAHVAMDCTIVALLAQARVQLNLLRYNLEHITDEEMKGTHKSLTKFAKSTVHKLKSYNYTDDEHILKEFHGRLVRCVVHYKKIKWFVKETVTIFPEALAFQVFVNAWVVCMTVYKLVNLNTSSLVELMVMALYLFCMLVQFFIYCYHGTQVQYESMFVSQSVYLCEWAQLPPPFRRLLLIMMVNCSEPIVPMTASIIPITVKTYITALRASYTLFTFLNRK